MVDATLLERAQALKQALMEFVLEAEGELAQALETFAADKSRSQVGDITHRDLLIDTFLTEGKVGTQTPLELFLDQTELTEDDRQLLASWSRTFIGLFAVVSASSDGLEVRNWLTDKHYTLSTDTPETARQEGEILLTRIAPLDENRWMFSGSPTVMGKLGKPKLAVAIGNFRQSYKSALYSDAPDLLEQAWQSVEQYHQEFSTFFGGDEVVLPGYQLDKKLQEFQEQLTQKQLSLAGIDPHKSLTAAATEAGVEPEAIDAVAESLGMNAQTASQVFNQKSAAKMVTPKIELPPDLKKAEQVTVLADARWGQMFLPTYHSLKVLLEGKDWQNVKGGEKMVRSALESPSFNAFVWRRLAHQYATPLETGLRSILDRPEFTLDNDLDSLLQEFKKPLEPELPDIASVPLHLHTLFQEALTEVSKTKPKGKSGKGAKGFG